MKINYWQEFRHDNYYHIYNHAVSDRNIFNAKCDYKIFLDKHYKYLSCAFETIAYCLMPNHFHFVLKVRSNETILNNAKKEISNASFAFQKGEIDVDHFILDQFRRFFSSYTLSYNFQHKRKGQLFQKRFKRVALDADLRLIYMIVYIHHNPVHHKFVSDFSLWKYSSYHNYNANQIEEQYLHYVREYFGNIEYFHQVHDDFKIDFKESNLDMLE